MSQIFTADHISLREAMREATDRSIVPYAAQVDAEDRWVPEYRKMMSDMGLPGMVIPDDLGGGGADVISQCIVMEELFRGSAAAGLMVSATWACVNTLLSRPSAANRPFLTKIAEESSLAAYCMTEPSAGSDAGSVTTTAVRDGDSYVLNGTKCFITNGGDADVYSILATTAPGTGSRGTSMFAIAADAPGLSATRFEDKMGTRGVRLAEISLQDVIVPAEQRLGQEGEGLRIAMESQNVSRLYMAAACIGIASAALEHACRYAKTREQFGRPISDFQLVQALAADASTELAAARALTYDCANLVNSTADKGFGSQDIRRQAAMAKLFTSNMVMKVTDTAIQLMGGYGYLRDYGAERHFRDAKIFQIFAGTNQIQQISIGRSVFRNV